MFGWFERQIDPFERGSETRPPEKILEPLAERFRKSNYDIASLGAKLCAVVTTPLLDEASTTFSPSST